MQRWLLLVLLGCAIAFAMVLRQQQVQIEQGQTLLESMMDPASVKYIVGERRYEFYQRPGESMEHLVTRAEGHVFGGAPFEAGDFCETLHCVTSGGVHYTVEICAPSQETLDRAVEFYCDTHDCDC